MSLNKPIIEDGIIAGNLYNKYGTKNFIARYLVENFTHSICQLLTLIEVSEVHEIGCGEGHISITIAQRKPKLKVRACDFSSQIINIAQKNAKEASVNIEFKTSNIYDLSPHQDSSELVVCCEVLEHLENPIRAMEVLSRLAKPYLIISVPREPIWRILNLARGKYLTRLGNTPGHIQHWSKGSFLKMLSDYVDIIQVLTPLPWTVVLCRSKM